MPLLFHYAWNCIWLIVPILGATFCSWAGCRGSTSRSRSRKAFLSGLRRGRTRYAFRSSRCLCSCRSVLKGWNRGLGLPSILSGLPCIFCLGPCRFGFPKAHGAGVAGDSWHPPIPHCCGWRASPSWVMPASFPFLICPGFTADYRVSSCAFTISMLGLSILARHEQLAASCVDRHSLDRAKPVQ